MSSIITPKQMVEDVMGILNNVVQDFPEGEREELKAKILDSFSATMFNAPIQEHNDN